LVRQNGSWKWIWIPGLIYALFFTACLYIFYTTSGQFSEYIIKHTYIKEWLQSSNQFLSFLFVTSAVMVHLLVLIYYFSLLRLLYQLLCAPLIVYLSRRIYAYATGAKTAVSSRLLVQDSGRFWTVVLKNALWQTVYFVALIIISLIPVVGWVTPLAGLLAECYYSGHPRMDMACNRRGISIGKAAHFISLHKGLAIGNGMVFYLLVIIPFAGWVAAPVYSVVAATLTADHLND
jgi:CysZ protein